MVDSIETPSIDAAATSARVVLPKRIVATILVLTFLPYVLNLLGFDFSAVTPPVQSAENSILSDVEQHRPVQEAKVGENVYTLLEWSTVCAAAFIAVLAFTHYYIKRDPTTPIIGTALFFSGMLDAFQILAVNGLITTAVIDERFIPFTWAISRSVNACFIAFGASPFLSNDRGAIDRAKRRGIRFIFLVGILFAVLSYSIIHVCAVIPSLPKTVYPAPAVVHRPWDVIPLVLYLFAGGMILPRFHRLHPSLFSYSLLLSIVPNVVAQLHAAFGSTVVYDNHFNIATYLKLIAYLVPLIGLVLDYMRAYRMEIAQQATEVKLRVARDVLQGLLPQSAPTATGFDIAAASTPADAIGGDYFDYILMGNECLGVVIADVSGHEIGASILLSQTRAYLRALAHRHTDIGEIMTQLNRFLIDDVRQRWFVELFLVRLNPKTNSFSYVGAGHEGYLLNASGEVTTLKSTTTPLGVVDQASVPTGPETKLQPSDMLLVFSDGIVEAAAPNGEHFGLNRAIELTAAIRDKPASEIVDSLMDSVREFRHFTPQKDDITVAVIKRRGTS